MGVPIKYLKRILFLLYVSMKVVLSGFVSLHVSNESAWWADFLALCINEKAVISRFISFHVSLKRPWWADFPRFMYQWKEKAVMSGFFLASCINEKAIISRFISYVSLKRPWLADFPRFMYQWKKHISCFICRFSFFR